MALSAFDNAIRALEIAISRRETLLDWLTIVLILCDLIVVVGLVVEFHEEAREFVTGRPRTRRRWRLSFVGGVAVVLGILGELFITFEAHRVETHIRSDSHRIEGLLSTKAGDAADNATRANSEADSARESATVIGRQADELRRKTIDLANKLSQAEKAELKEHEKVVGMESWLSPRYLTMTGGPKGESWASLKPFAGTNAIIESVPDTEARYAAQQIAVLLHVANWNVSRVNINLELEAMDGVTVLWSFVDPKATNTETLLREGRKSEEAAVALDDLLEDSGWDAKAEPGSSSATPLYWVPPNTVRIQVGLKPYSYGYWYLPEPVQDELMSDIKRRHQEREYHRKVRQWEKGGRVGPEPSPPLWLEGPRGPKSENK